MSDYIAIDNHLIGPGLPCFIIAEVGNAHDGSLGTAHAYIDAIARTGASAVKFQTHIAAAESTKAEQFRVPFSYQDASRYDYWKRLEFTPGQWKGLAEHASECGLVFLSTPFSHEAVEMLNDLVPAWKVGSGELTNLPLLRRMRETGKPMLLSSGMATWDELDAAVAASGECAVLQCTTAYPCKAEYTGLNVMGEMRERYGCPVGLSDHSGEVFPAYAAAALGANLVEVHVTLSHYAFGPDVLSSVTVEQLTELVRGVRFIGRALTPVDKDQSAGHLRQLKEAFSKSIVAAHDLPAGKVLEASDITLKKPGTGLSPDFFESCVGRRLATPLKADEMLREECLV